jgi:hypothetical protein
MTHRVTEAQLIEAIELVSEIILSQIRPLLDRRAGARCPKRGDDPISRSRRHLARAQAAPTERRPS